MQCLIRYFDLAPQLFLAFLCTPFPWIDPTGSSPLEFGSLFNNYYTQIYQPLPLGQVMTQGQFLSGVKQVWIQSFLSPRLVASPRLENQSSLLFTHSWKENNWINTFPKGISAMWNAISLVQDLNSYRCIHFLRRQPLHHGHLSITTIRRC